MKITNVMIDSKTDARIEIDRAKQIASKYITILKPHCEKIQIAGSIRRKKSYVGDIEIVCIPKTVVCQIDMFESETKACPEFVYQVNSRMGDKIKGSPLGKYCQRLLPEGVKLDLFIATPINWGLIFAIRTGSAEFSRYLATTWVQKGYYGEGGMLHSKNDGEQIPIRSESDLFSLLDINFVSPEEREW